MNKKKLLLITAISPFPQDSGGATRIKNTIQELSKSFDLHLVSFINPDYKFTPEERKKLNKWCQQSIFIPISDHKTPGSYFDIGQPYWFSDWYSPELIASIENVFKNQNIDIIQIEFSQLLYLIDYLGKYNKKCIFTAHDISTISFFRRLSEVKNIKYKIIHFFRFLEIYFYEKKYIPKYDQINAVSDNDNFLIKKYFNPQKIVTVANGIEKIDFLKAPIKKNDQIILGYIGSFSHPPNRTAFLYFINEIAPILEKNNINYKYLLAGKNDDCEINWLLSKKPQNIKNKIVNLGFVENTKDFFQKIDILITPIFAGSGSRIKILEALGFGKKVISSKVGAEGININTKLISIADTPQEYVKEIMYYLKNKSKINLDVEKNNIGKLTWKDIFKNYSTKI